MFLHNPLEFDSRYEVELAACLTAASRSWHAAQEEAFRSTADTSWRIAFHAFRSDATNSTIWQRSKLHVADIMSAYIEEGGDHNCRHAWTEILRVGEATAVGPPHTHMLSYLIGVRVQSLLLSHICIVRVACLLISTSVVCLIQSVRRLAHFHVCFGLRLETIE